MADQPNNVFDGTTPPAGEPTPSGVQNPPSDNLQDLLKNIKNDQGEQKYKSLEDALVALDHSQKYIPELKTQLSGTQQELNEMKVKMEKFGNIEETVQRLLAQKQEPQAHTPPSATGLDEQAVMKLVQQSLQARESQTQMQVNQKTVNDALVAKFGDKVIETLESKAKELNTTRQALGELAKNNPKLVLALFETHTQNINPTLPSRRTPEPMKPNPASERPAKSMLSGVSVRDQAARLNQIRDGIYTKHGIDK